MIWAISLPAAWAWPSNTGKAWCRPRGSRTLDQEVVTAVQAMAADFLRLFPALEFGRALAQLWEVIGLLNRYIVATAPWELAKQPEAAGRLDTVLYHLLEGLRWIAALLRPVMPASALKMSEQLGLGLALWDQPLDQVLHWGRLVPGSRWPRARPCFRGSRSRSQGSTVRVTVGTAGP